MTSPFEFTYCKHKHPLLFESLERANTGLNRLQNYIPLYSRFFSLSESNHNSIGLNHRRHVRTVTTGPTKNTVIGELETDDPNVSATTLAFVKYSPLLDPIKYMSGKYDMRSPDLLALPSFTEAPATSVHQTKMRDVNNSSYVDAFFTYLTSQVLHAHGFLHGLDFYGSYLAVQDEFTVNVYDELEYFNTCDFFLKHRDKLFRVDSDAFESRASNYPKPALKLSDSDSDCIDLDLEELNTFNGVFEPNSDADLEPALVQELNTLDLDLDLNLDLDLDPALDPALDTLDPALDPHSDDSDSCSSRSSASSDDNPDHCRCDGGTGSNDGTGSDGSDDGTGSDGSDDGSGSHDGTSDGSKSDGTSGSDDEVHNAHIFNFPVHAIMMEKCDNTLDSLMSGKNEMTEPEWAATIMQVIMALVAYQHMFAFTHNDLHTNNIMFVKTDKKYLHYLHKGVYYRVPTHGRIMKIIDFGRAIYKYRGQTMVSDSFDRTGDAATQYNCEPYLNPKKPRLDPNPSFDLCRLACSLFDYFVEDIRDEAEYAATLKESRMASVVVEWLKDDKGRNVLYKKNGDERYPDFKLYKMIARTVHGAVPHEQLSKPMFAHYAIPRKQIKGKPRIMDIDALPSYTQLN
jgi:hypothetical protein